jgi:hypothetical protein
MGLSKLPAAMKPASSWRLVVQIPLSGNREVQVDELSSVDALLLGKTTYEAFAAFWPGQTGEGFADPINRMPK